MKESGAVRLPMSCLADYIESGSRSAQSRLRPFKFPKRGEGLVRVSYYQPALTTIRSYHARGNDPRVIDREVLELRKLADTSEGNKRTKLNHNATALEAYRKMYGNRNFRVLKNPTLEYRIGRVVFTARPDLRVEEHGTQILLKLGLAKHKRRHIDILLSVLRKAAVSSGHRIRMRNIVYLDISSGQEICASGGLTRYNKIFATAAQEIAELWPEITMEGN